MFASTFSIRIPARYPGDTTPFTHLCLRLVQAIAEGTVRDLLEPHFKKAVPGIWRPEGLIDGGLLAGDELLYTPPIESYELWLSSRMDPGGDMWKLEAEHLPVIADFARRGFMSEEDIRDGWFLDEDLPSSVLATAETRRTRWPRADRPGIYRREHASLLIRSRTTGILLDPVSNLPLPSLNEAPLPPYSDEVQAIAITHSHGDHWDLPALLAVAGANEALPILVPKVPRMNLLCQVDFESQLQVCGQTGARAVGWGETVRIGDIEIDVLPFYGEQACREGGGPPDVRSWGNCYRFNTEDFSCIVLVDGGADPMGSMVDVVRTSCEKRGAPDVILACQREFASPFFSGLGNYWVTVPYAQLVALHGQFMKGTLPMTTAGVQGAAAACEAAKARYFLPYANGYAGPGRPIADIGWGLGEPPEADRVAWMTSEFRRNKSATKTPLWNPGDVALFDKGQLTFRRFEEGPRPRPTA